MVLQTQQALIYGVGFFMQRIWWEIISLLGDKSFPGDRKDLAEKFVSFVY